MKKTFKNLLVQINGGTGKNIAFAHILPELKEKYEHVSVISPYADVFEAHPDCDYVYNPNTPNAIKSAFEDARDDTLIVIDHIYDTHKFIKKEQTYQDAFREMCGLEEKDGKNLYKLDENRLKPEAKYPGLIQQRDGILKDLESKGYSQFILFQHTGGQSPLVQVPVEQDPKTNQPQARWDRVPYQGQQNGLSRHYPEGKAAEFVKEFKARHPGTAVVSFTLPNEPYIEGTERYVAPYLLYHLLARDSKCVGVVTIDSCLQHLVVGLNKVVVLWAHTDSHTFGYANNKNIEQKCNRDGIHYFTGLGPANNRVDYIAPHTLADEVDEYLFDGGIVKYLDDYDKAE